MEHGVQWTKLEYGVQENNTGCGFRDNIKEYGVQWTKLQRNANFNGFYDTLERNTDYRGLTYGHR